MTHKALKKFCKHHGFLRRQGDQCSFNYEHSSFTVGNHKDFQPGLKRICPFFYWKDYQGQGLCGKAGCILQGPGKKE